MSFASEIVDGVFEASDLPSDDDNEEDYRDENPIARKKSDICVNQNITILSNTKNNDNNNDDNKGTEHVDIDEAEKEDYTSYEQGYLDDDEEEDDNNNERLEVDGADTETSKITKKVMGSRKNPGKLTQVEVDDLKRAVTSSADPDSSASSKTKIPEVPPRKKIESLKISVVSDEDVSNWFVVMSPRETKGVTGPFSISQLRKMYKYGEISDNNLLWQEGLRAWQQLCYIHSLRFRLLQLPRVPPRLNAASADGVFNPVPEIPSVAQVALLKGLADMPLYRTCERCGAAAVGHTVGLGETIPDLYALRSDVGSTSRASEIIPGFLWIGGVDSSKKTSIAELRTTLIINCTKNQKSPQPRPPFFRCKVIPLKERPKGERPVDLDGLLDLLESAHDWIENERTIPERSSDSDMPLPYYRGVTDKYGRPVEKQIPPWRVVRGQKDPPRVLVYSREGFDRTTLVVASYLIKHYGATITTAMEIIEKARPGSRLSISYQFALQEWSKRYTLGEQLCMDCVDAAIGENGIPDPKNVAIATLDLESAPIYEDFKIATKRNDAITALGDPASYLPKVFMGAADIEKRMRIAAKSPAVSARWSGLMDLSLNGQRLGDAGVSVLLKALTSIGVTNQLRLVELKDNGMKQEGAIQMVEAFQSGNDWAHGELIVLDIAHNRIGEDDDSGATAIANFISEHQNITYLDISNNALKDLAAAEIIAALANTFSDFIGDELDDEKNDEDDEDDDDKGVTDPFNKSLIDLRIESNDLGTQSATALAKTLKNNYILTNLRLDFNTSIPMKDLRELCNNIRQFNVTLNNLSLSDISLTVKAAGYISKLLTARSLPLRTLELSRCDLTSLHLAPFANTGKNSLNLTHLDLSGNNIGDTGAEWVATILRGIVDKNDYGEKSLPPLKYLDLNCCGLEYHGCKDIIGAASVRPNLLYLDLSDNNFYGGNEAEANEQELMEYFSNCCFRALHLNRCKLQSRGAIQLFQLLKNTSAGSLGSHLRILSLSSNDIHDQAADSFNKCMQSNSVLEIIDLGFNNFTDRSKLKFKEASTVESSSVAERKLLNLSVNMIGNTMSDPYAMSTPGMARAKSNFNIGTRGLQDYPGMHSSSMTSLAHVQKPARDHFAMRSHYDEKYHKEISPKKKINFIS